MRKSILKSLKPDIIVEMLDMAVAFENWSKVMERADMLYQCVQCIHEERQEYQAKRLPLPFIHTERPLIYYHGFSLQMRGMAHQKMGQVDQARACIDQYAELGGMEELDEAGTQVVQEFRHRAQVNRYALEIDAGNAELLEAYVNFLLEHPEECIAGLRTIIEAAVRYRWQIDRVLHMFASRVQGIGREMDSSNNRDMEYILPRWFNLHTLHAIYIQMALILLIRLKGSLIRYCHAGTSQDFRSRTLEGVTR
ncbi:DNA-binding protein [Paenibacillus sp. JNUCC31]|uniref:DNA-binding protein n=1 Tax=Paenibacillus sp. JNUCC-31 TaxID=2777983 RepID=UPI0017828A9D|nr:DNA-binding protein [Paenibacillus sp. JNUCC-31]QOS81873.1 DNA-binding protein [Paenibacillus sp. JNUCC-31]